MTVPVDLHLRPLAIRNRGEMGDDFRGINRLELTVIGLTRRPAWVSVRALRPDREGLFQRACSPGISVEIRSEKLDIRFRPTSR